MMPPAPAEGQMMMMPMGTPNMAGTISLSTLIDFIIQRTYHELSVLSELLPRKTDMERKIEIYQFANRTRQLFIRLLALIRWTNSASKVDKCARISSFLHSQQMLFVETADMLARLARETLVHARLPSFSLPCAVDVLTLGTYPRLPLCIKEKILPPEPITATEKAQTLKRLSQIIEHRVVMTDLQPYMRKPRIEDGRVKFLVENEFEVTLTLMGDGLHVPWRLLDIEILVEDCEMSEGQSLVHSLQVGYIHQIVQTRLLENDRPLHDLYNCLHTFCQSLQLEVLHSQIQSLIRLRLGDSVRVEEYVLGKSLVLSYWRDPTRKEVKPFQQQYRLQVHVDNIEISKPLQLTHTPQIHGSESTRVPRAVQSDHLSIEKLLVQTVHVRSLAKLKDLERELRMILHAPCEIRDHPSSVLCVSVLSPCLDCEKLYIAVNVLRGSFTVSLQQKVYTGSNQAGNSVANDIEQCLNADRKDLRRLISDLRCWLMLQRCCRSLQYVHTATCSSSLPLAATANHGIESLSKHRLYINLPLLSTHYLIVEVVEVYKRKLRTAEYRYHLLAVSPDDDEASGSTNADAGLDSTPAGEQHQLLLKPGHMMRLDIALGTKGPGGKLLDVDYKDPDEVLGKRKILQDESYETTYGYSKKVKSSDYFVSDLLHIVGLCSERLPLVALAEELERNGMSHSGLKVDGDGLGMSLTLLEAPQVTLESRRVARMLKSSLVSFTFRMLRRERAAWFVEIVLTDSPIRTTTLTEQSTEQRVCITLDKVSRGESISSLLTSVMDDWNSIALLYSLVLDFSHSYNVDAELRKEIEVKSYNYKRISLAYGPNKCYVVHVTYSILDKKFVLNFATVGQPTTSNCHTLVSTYLQEDLNKSKSLTQLSKTLYSTWLILSCVGKLNLTPVMFLKNKPQIPQPTFSILIESALHYRLMYRNHHCLDVYCRDTGTVLIRDGAYGVFDSSNAVEGVSPIPGLQTFLSMFVDDSVSSRRRRPTIEDDNPPSPENAFDPLSSALPPSDRRGALRNDMIIAPSPSSMMAQSPGNPGSLPVPSPSAFNVPVPSPGVHMPSPAGSFMGHQGMSPASRNWPNSPSSGPASQGVSVKEEHPKPGSQHTARSLPQRSWAASIPTALSHEAFNRLLTPCSLIGGQNEAGGASVQCCPLERFLGSVFLRRHLLRIVQSEESQLTMMPGPEHGVVTFKAECGLQFHVGLNPTTMQSLRMKINQVQELPTQWDMEDLQTLEKFFYTKVASPPYRPNPMLAFMYLLRVQPRILKDFIQIMKLELSPDRSLKWGLNWCLTIPYGWSAFVPDHTIGAPAVAIGRKILFVLHLARDSSTLPQTADQPAINQSAVVPILYDCAVNATSMMELKPPFATPLHINIFNILKQFNERFNNATECTIYPAVRDILGRLSANA